MASVLRKKNNKILYNNLSIIIIFIAILLLGIGYAQVSDVHLDITGQAGAEVTKEVLITSVTYDSNNYANPSDSTINNTNLTFMNSTITLGNNLASSITYKVKIKNNTDIPVIYNDALFSTTLGYDNTDIELLDNINNAYIVTNSKLKKYKKLDNTKTEALLELIKLTY